MKNQTPNQTNPTVGQGGRPQASASHGNPVVMMEPIVTKDTEGAEA